MSIIEKWYVCVGLMPAMALALTLSSEAGSESEIPVRCSVIQLIANPDQFDGMVVQTYGFATIGFERNYLYLSRDDARYGLVANALPLDVPTMEKVGALLRFDGKYVLVEGTFDASLKSGFAPANGGITKISRMLPVEAMPTPEDRDSQ
jgi:hypothetical protein